MYRFKLITVYVICCILAGLLMSCASSFHKKQYLINRNYLYNIGLSKPTELLDIKGDDGISAIHIGMANDTIVKDYMLFNSDGNLLSVNKLHEPDVKLVEFRYDSQGKLSYIIPNANHFATLDYDSLKVIYDKFIPIKLIALANNAPLWEEEITFDDNKGEYLFKKRNNTLDLFSSYNFKQDKIIAEYHRNQINNLQIDSTKYLYRDGLLTEKKSFFSDTYITTTVYDNEERPKHSITALSKSDSIAWEDQYNYQGFDRIPYNITTTSPLGWKEEVNYIAIPLTKEKTNKANKILQLIKKSK